MCIQLCFGHQDGIYSHFQRPWWMTLHFLDDLVKLHGRLGRVIGLRTCEKRAWFY